MKAPRDVPASVVSFCCLYLKLGRLLPEGDQDIERDRDVDGDVERELRARDKRRDAEGEPGWRGLEVDREREREAYHRRLAVTSGGGATSEGISYCITHCTSLEQRNTGKV